MRGQRHASAALYPWERLGTHCAGGWVDSRAGMDRCGKSGPHRDSIPGPVAVVTTLPGPQEQHVDEDKYGALEDIKWRPETEIFGEKSVPFPLRPPKIYKTSPGHALNEQYNNVRVFCSELLDGHIFSRPPNEEAVPTVNSLSTWCDLMFRHTHLKCENEYHLKLSISTQTNVCDCYTLNLKVSSHTFQCLQWSVYRRKLLKWKLCNKK